MRRARIRLSAFLLVIAACDAAPSGLDPESLLPSAAIQDAAHDGGNEHFFWLPPLVEAPEAFNGPFNGAQSPSVVIERLCADPGCPEAVVTFSEGSGSEEIRVEAEDELYIVNWHTGDFAVEPDATYRIRVEALGQSLGFADVRFADGAKEAKNLTTGEVIGLVDGRTLPIKFRIEGGAAVETLPIAADEPTSVEALDGDVAIEVPANALTEETEITVEPVDPVGDATVVVEFGPAGLTFEEPIQVTLAYDESALGGVAEQDLALNIFEDGEWIVIPGSFVDPVTNVVSAPFFHFSRGGVGPASKAVFCSGDTNPNTFESLQEAVDAVMPGGTVDVCDGTHVVESVVLSRPVTVQAKTGAAPVLSTSVERQAFLVDGYASGVVTLDGLAFDFNTPTGSPTSYAIRASGTWDQLVVTNTTFDVDPVARGSIVALASTTPDALLTVDNVSTSGGVYGIAMIDVHAAVTNSTFSGARFMGVQYASTGSPTGGVVQNSTFVDCGTYCARGWGTESMLITNNDFGQCGSARCIGTTNGANVDIVGNRFVQQILTGDPVPDPNNQVFIAGSVTATVQGNTFNGCAYFSCIDVRGTATVSDNDFHHVAGQPEFEYATVVGAFWTLNATFDGNRIHSCAVFCYNIGNGSNVTIRNETVNAPAGHGTTELLTMHIFDDPAAPANVVVLENNSLAGPGASGSLSVFDTDLTMNGNTFSQISNGLHLMGGITHVTTITGRDNVLSSSGTALVVQGGTSVDLRFNDFTGQSTDLEHDEPSAVLTCNWWGDAAGPDVVIGSAPATVYTPFATAPIANTGAVGCGP